MCWQNLSYTHTLCVHTQIKEQFQFHEYSQASKQFFLRGNVMSWHHSFWCLFWSGVEGIVALVTHFRKVMPWSITLSLAESMRAPAYGCLHRAAGMPGKIVHLR